MVRMTRAAVVAAIVWALPIAIGAQQPAAGPIYQAVVVDKRSPEEQTLAERIAHLDAVLVVKVIAEPRGVAVGVPTEWFGPLANRPDFDPPPFVHTETPVEILEVFKGSPAAGVAGARTLVVTSGGNAAWKEGRAIGNDGPPLLVVGGTYIVLLSSRRPDVQPYAANTDIFHLDRGRLVAHGSAPQAWPFAQSVLNLPWRDALAAFHAAAAEAERLP